jgi:hypothetical protein
MSSNTAYLDPERDRVDYETSDAAFDRLAFAERALRVLGPLGLRVALCPARVRLTVETGRLGASAPGVRWALVAIPPMASRRAIAVALAAAAGERITPFALDALIAEEEGTPRDAPAVGVRGILGA